MDNRDTHFYYIGYQCRRRNRRKPGPAWPLLGRIAMTRTALPWSCSLSRCRARLCSCLLKARRNQP